MIDIALHGGAFGGVKETIKKIQHFENKLEVSKSSDAISIEPVMNENSVIIYHGNKRGTGYSSGYISDRGISIFFLSDSEVQIERGNNPLNEAVVNFSIVEFYKLKSKQSGFVELNGFEVKDISIDNIDSNKSLAFATAKPVVNTNTKSIYSTIPLVNLAGDKVTIDNIMTEEKVQTYWQVIEFL